MTDERPDWVQILIVRRGGIQDFTLGVAGYTRCDKCGRGVLLMSEEAATKVAARTWRAVCEECARALQESDPDTFQPENRVR